jgi:hypothetical protein
MDKDSKYTLHLTKRQVQLLSYACDRMSRLICGQDWSFKELMEQAWEKRCKKATGAFMDSEWDNGYHSMIKDAETISKWLKKRFWGLGSTALYGMGYDDTSDILFDIHSVLRHQLWEDSDNKTPYTVDADKPTTPDGSEPLAEITRE